MGSSQKPSTYSEVNLAASDLSYTSQFPFKLSAKGPGNSDLKVEGKAGPMNATDSSLTPLNATIDVQHLDLATTGFIEPSSGIAGVMDFKGDLNSDGKQMSSKGNIKINKLKASSAGSPSTVPVNLDYATVYTLDSQSGVLNQGDIKIGSAVQHLTGTYNMAGDPTKVNMKLNAQGMPLNDLEGFLPAVGVVLPSGSKLQGGNLTVSLSISGPIDKPTIAGPVNISNTKLAGFSLKSKLGALGSFTGMGGGGGGNDTDIQTLSRQYQERSVRHEFRLFESGPALDRHRHRKGNRQRFRPAKFENGCESRRWTRRRDGSNDQRRRRSHQWIGRRARRSHWRQRAWFRRLGRRNSFRDYRYHLGSGRCSGRSWFGWGHRQRRDSDRRR